jgi:hypothetical protein
LAPNLPRIWTIVDGPRQSDQRFSTPEAEADRDGWLSLDDVLAEMDDLIAAKRDAA